MYVCYHYRCILQIKDVDAIVHQCNRTGLVKK